MALFAFVLLVCIAESLLIKYAVRWYLKGGVGYVAKVDLQLKRLILPRQFRLAIFRPRPRYFIRTTTIAIPRLLPVVHFAIRDVKEREGEVWFAWWPLVLPFVAYLDWELALGVAVLAVLSAVAQLIDAPRIIGNALLEIERNERVEQRTDR